MSAVAVAKEDEEEDAFDFDCVSEEECDGKCEEECECPQQPPNNPAPQAPQPSTDSTAADSTAADSTAADSMVVEDDDGSEDLVGYEMPEIEAGEMEKIEDPLANEENGGRRKRAHPKVDYVALEAQLKKEEEEMRQKMAKHQWFVC